MIRISEEARAHVRRLLSGEGAPGAALRITVDAGPNGGDLRCELEVAERPEPGDTVLETGGVRLFLGPRAADALDDAELIVEAGELALALPEAAGCGPG